MELFDVDFEGIGVESVTMLAAAGVDADNESHVCKVSGDKTADVCDAEDQIYGVIGKYDAGNGVVRVDRKGFKEVGYTGVITAGFRELVADGAGGVKAPSVGVQASLVTGVEASNNAIRFTALAYGEVGENVRVQLKDPAGNDQTLAVDVVGADVIVSLATGGAGAITSTAAEVIAAVNASAAATMVTADDEGASTGAVVVEAVALTALDGGVDPSVGRYFHVVNVDTSAGTLMIDLG